MDEHEPDRRPPLQRPLGSLLDVSIGTALKAYALWWIGGSLKSQTPPELREDCIGYERAGGRDGLVFFCFADGTLTSKLVGAVG